MCAILLSVDFHTNMAFDSQRDEVAYRHFKSP